MKIPKKKTIVYLRVKSFEPFLIKRQNHITIFLNSHKNLLSRLKRNGQESEFFLYYFICV